MNLLGSKFTKRVLNKEIEYQSAKHKMKNVQFAIQECVKAYDLESLIKVAEEGLKPWNEGLGGFGPSAIPGENQKRRWMAQEGITYEEAHARWEAQEKMIYEDLFGKEGEENEIGEGTESTAVGTETGTGKTGTNTESEQSSEKGDNEEPAKDEPGAKEDVQPEKETPKQRPKVKGKVTKRQ